MNTAHYQIAPLVISSTEADVCCHAAKGDCWLKEMAVLHFLDMHQINKKVVLLRRNLFNILLHVMHSSVHPSVTVILSSLSGLVA